MEIGLYRDDGLAVLDQTPQKIEKIKKEICKVFPKTTYASPSVMGCYSTQSELARHDSRAHVQQLTIFSTTPAYFARHATRDVNITFPLTSSLKHIMNKQKQTK